MDTSHCLEYLTAQASRLKYATYNIGFMKVRMESRCVCEKKQKKNNKKQQQQQQQQPTHTPHTHHVWVQTKLP